MEYALELGIFLGERQTRIDLGLREVLFPQRAVAIALVDEARSTSRGCIELEMPDQAAVGIGAQRLENLFEPQATGDHLKHPVLVLRDAYLEHRCHLARQISHAARGLERALLAGLELAAVDLALPLRDARQVIDPVLLDRGAIDLAKGCEPQTLGVAQRHVMAAVRVHDLVARSFR